MDMFSGVYVRFIGEEVKAKRIPMSRLDDAVRRILRVKFRLGLFDKTPPDPRASTDLLDNPHARVAARRVARESLILVKNDGILPLTDKTKSIAVIGAFATHDENKTWTSPHHLPPPQVTTLPQALQQQLGDKARITYARGTTQTCGDSYISREEVLETARQADVIIAMLGEDCHLIGEAASRTQLGLPGIQQELLEALITTQKPVILIVVSGRPLVLTWAHDHVAAILQTFHAGVEARPAIADVLTGAFNPSGKLPMSFPRVVGQIPVYYNHLPTGRPGNRADRYTSIFVDEVNEPLYPFGFGLSYTTFAYNNIRLNQEKVREGQTLGVTVDVTNSGARDGQEVVQLYIRQPIANRSRPVRELKGFEKVFLKAKETRQVQFKLPASSLGYHDDQGRYHLDSGLFEVYVGGSSLAQTRSIFMFEGKQP
jgi:beta-glucosidase